MDITIVFVHGYSVTNLDTYGELPLRLKAEAALRNINIVVKEIFLGRYISFNDEVTLNDISRAFETALKDELESGQRFVCITHSTGGPVVRDWWQKTLDGQTASAAVVPSLSHLIMLAPANFGSALAQLGKSRLSRIKAWFDRVDPGQKVLDWLELGSKQAWDLNTKWVKSAGSQIGEHGVFPFVITGQSIDRKLYDHLNPYTGELGSDGVVRVACANLNARYVKLIQKTERSALDKIVILPNLEIAESEFKESVAVPMRIVRGKSHSNVDMGIMRSVDKAPGNDKSTETVNAILDCIAVKNIGDYGVLIEKFDRETAQVQKDELIEETGTVFSRHFIHDKFSQVIFRITDSEGYPVTDFDLIFTTGERNSPDDFPQGFVADRQRNKGNPEMITYFFNYSIMKGEPAGKYRKQTPGVQTIGLKVVARPDTGFVRFVECEINASFNLLDKALKPNSTTLVEIVLQRVVSKEVFRLEPLTQDTMPAARKQGDFKDTKAGNDIVE
ncbi:MAG TPA: phospholipase [Bacteroidia bacterium]|nr:phospholipase [Bacteroidia bacterium]